MEEILKNAKGFDKDLSKMKVNLEMKKEDIKNMFKGSKLKKEQYIKIGILNDKNNK